MGELISKLLSTNFATVISVIVAALALAFIYWIAIPAIRRTIELERELKRYAPNSHKKKLSRK